MKEGIFMRRCRVSDYRASPVTESICSRVQIALG